MPRNADVRVAPRIVAEHLDRQSRLTDEGPQQPAQLDGDKDVKAKPNAEKEEMLPVLEDERKIKKAQQKLRGPTGHGEHHSVEQNRRGIVHKRRVPDDC